MSTPPPVVRFAPFLLALFCLWAPPASAQAPVVDWSTPFGGSGVETAFAPVQLSNGHVVVVGATSSGSFLGEASLGGDDVFVACFDPADFGTSQLIWVRRIGGSGRDVAYEAAVDENDDVWLVGFTDSVDFPTSSSAYQTTLAGPGDAFAVHLDGGNGATQWATLIGGTGRDGAVGLALEGNTTWIAGYSESGDFPTSVGAVQPTSGGGRDAFVAGFDASVAGAASLVYSTYLGGAGDEGLVPASLGGQSFEFDRLSIDVNDAGVLAICGSTLAADFPTTPSAFASTRVGDREGFVSVFGPSPAGAGLQWSTYFGGSDEDQPFEVRWLADGTLAVAGTTVSPDLPTDLAAEQPFFGGGGFDGFVARFDPMLSGTDSLLTSTYLGGAADDSIVGMTVLGATTVAVVGNSRGQFPTSSDAWIPAYPGTTAFCGRVSFVDLQVPATLGFSSFWSESGGSVIWGVNARDDRLAFCGWTGDDDFPIVNPYQASGVTLIGAVAATASLPVGGPEFVRGDVNLDGGIDISDAIAILSALFSGGLLECADAADTNDDGANDIADAVLLLSSLFVPGSMPISAPSPDCGEDPTPDALDCAGVTGC